MARSEDFGVPPAEPLSKEDFLAAFPPTRESHPPMDLNREIIRNLRATDPAECKALERTGRLSDYCTLMREACTQDARDRMARGQRECEAWRLAIRTIIHELDED